MISLHEVKQIFFPDSAAGIDNPNKNKVLIPSGPYNQLLMARLSQGILDQI
jgi:hypothetical protein